MSNAKVNFIFVSVLAIITLIVSYKTCAQSIQMNGCRLLALENEIDNVEKQIDEVYARIIKDNNMPPPEAQRFFDEQKPNSIWKDYEGRIRRASTYIDRQVCDRRSNPTH